jgi:hypothetical protein
MVRKIRPRAAIFWVVLGWLGCACAAESNTGKDANGGTGGSGAGSAGSSAGSETDGGTGGGAGCEWNGRPIALGKSLTVGVDTCSCFEPGKLVCWNTCDDPVCPPESLGAAGAGGAADEPGAGGQAGG